MPRWSPSRRAGATSGRVGPVVTLSGQSQEVAGCVCICRECTRPVVSFIVKRISISNFQIFRNQKSDGSELDLGTERAL